MTFSNTISNLIVGTNRDATKIPEWQAYIWKTTEGLGESDIAAGKFRLVFVKSSGDQFVYRWDGVSDYAYEGKVAKTGTNTRTTLTANNPTVSDKLVLDADLLEAMTYDSWEIGSQAIYDSRRVTPGEWM